jgi:hypothetical protein
MALTKQNIVEQLQSELGFLKKQSIEITETWREMNSSIVLICPG